MRHAAPNRKDGAMPDDPTPTPDPAPDPPVTPPPVDPPEPTPPADLGDAGKAALAAERKARKDAEKQAKDIQARLDAIEAEKLSDTEKLQRRADEGDKRAEQATAKLRAANLLTALTDAGLTGGKAKAAARLLDTIEYSNEDEPTNLTEALEAAKAIYGEEVFAVATTPNPTTPTAPNLNGGAGNEGREGPALEAHELQAAQQAGMTPEEYAFFKGAPNLAQVAQLAAKQ